MNELTLEERKQKALEEIKAVCEKYHVDIAAILQQTPIAIQATLTFIDTKPADQPQESLPSADSEISLPVTQ